MKRNFLIIMFIVFALIHARGQDIVEIEIGQAATIDTTFHIPCDGWTDYSWSTYILTADQIGTALNINEIQFNVANEPTSYQMHNQQIYLKQTQYTEPLNSYPDPNNNDYTLVFDGTVTWNNSGWQGITLDTDFIFENLSNLQIVWINNDGSWHENYPTFYKTDTNEESFPGVYRAQDDSFPENPGYQVSYFPNTKLIGNDISTITYSPLNNATHIPLMPTISLEVDVMYSSFDLYFGENPNPETLLVTGIPLIYGYSYSFSEPLEEYTDYYWTVILYNSDGNSISLDLTFKTSYFFDGEGTESNPYQVNTMQDLIILSENNELWDSYFLQTADIDASSASDLDEGAGFIPIGNHDSNFTGSYNGNDYTIYNLYINRLADNYIGLFGRTNTADLYKISLVNSEIIGDHYVGGLVGYAYNSSISNCYSIGNICGDQKVGGLVGYSEYLTCCNSYSKGDVSGTGEYEWSENSIGGLIGLCEEGSMIYNCYSNASISSGGTWSGGLIGRLVSSTISNCYSNGSIMSNGSAGGLIGSSFNDGETFVNNSFWDRLTSGHATSAGGTGLTTMQMRNINTYLDAGWDFVDETTNGYEDIWAIDPSVNSGYPYLDIIGLSMPEIISYYPEETELNIALGSTQIFNVEAENVDRFLFYKWYVNQEEQVTSFNQFLYTFTELNSYDVKVVISNGEYTTEQIWNISVAVSNDDNAENSIPFVSLTNYPNPFNPETTIMFSFDKNSFVDIKIYDVKGRLVRKLYKDYVEAGLKKITWDGLNNDNKRTVSGVYYVRMKSDRDCYTKKITLIK